MKYAWYIMAAAAVLFLVAASWFGLTSVPQYGTASTVLTGRQAERTLEFSHPLNLTKSNPVVRLSPEGKGSAWLAPDGRALTVRIYDPAPGSSYSAQVEGLFTLLGRPLPPLNLEILAPPESGSEKGTGVAAEPAPEFTMVMTGDVLLDERLWPGQRFAELGPDGVITPRLQSVLRNADFSMVNLECAVSDKGTALPGKKFTFRANPDSMEVLSAAGVDAANLANNHTFDFGKAAFLDTIENVRKAGVTPVGWGPNREQALTPAVFDLEGAKVAFLSFTHRVVLPPEYYGLWEAGTDKPGTIYWTSEQDMLTAVSRARESADIVVAVMHWNYEYEHTPRPDQVALAHRLVDSGAQLVVGHHPHLPYGVEVYNGVPIIYSLGNFIFHPYDLEARDSVVAEIRVKGDRLNSLDLVPIRDTDGQADLLAGEQADPVLAQVQDLCNRLGTNAIRDGDRLRIEIPH